MNKGYKMTEPEPMYTVNNNKKDDELMAEFKCLNCGNRIGDVMRKSNHIRYLRKDNGEVWEGHGSAMCPVCGIVRQWIPGQCTLDLLYRRHNHYQLT